MRALSRAHVLSKIDVELKWTVIKKKNTTREGCGRQTVSRVQCAVPAERLWTAYGTDRGWLLKALRDSGSRSLTNERLPHLNHTC